MTGNEHTEHVEAEPTAEQSHAPEFVYTDVAAGANYCFDVRAANRYGDSPWAPRACASTMHLLPAAPSGVTAAATSPTTILVTWTDNSGNEDGSTSRRTATSEPSPLAPVSRRMYGPA